MDRERLEDLAAAYLDGEMTPKEAAELVEGLRRDPEARRYLLRAAGNDVALHELAASGPRARASIHRPRARRSRRAIPVLIAASILAAAAALLVIALPGRGPAPTASPHHAKESPRRTEPAPAPREELRPPERREVVPPKAVPEERPDAPREEPPRRAPAPPPPAPPVEPPKPPPPPPLPAPKETVVAIGQIQRVHGQVFLDRAPAQAGQKILPKQRLATTGVDALVAVVAPDAARYELGADASAVFEAPGQVFLAEGELTVDLSVPAKDRPVTVTTANAEARALGTRFTVARRQEATHLEVEAGAVRFTRLHDDVGIDVRDGFQSVAMKGVMLTARRFLGPNLLADPGFEKGDPSWTKTDEAIAIVKAPARSGARSAQIPLTAQKDLALSQKLAVAPGATLHATAWLRVGEKTGKGALRAFLVWRDAKGGALRTDSVGRVEEAQDWARLGGRFAAPAGAAQAQLFFMAEGDPVGSGAAWVDDVSVRRRQ